MKKIFYGLTILTISALLCCASPYDVKPTSYVNIQDPIDPAIIGKWGQNADGTGTIWEFRANGKLMIGSNLTGAMFKYAASNGKGIYGIELNSLSTEFMYTFKGNKIDIFLAGKKIPNSITLPDQEYHFIKIE